MKISVLIVALALPVFATAQTDEQKSAVTRIAGETAGPALLSTYEAVNILADGWKNGTFADDRALELATSYRGSAELTLSLLRQAGDTPELKNLADGADSLVKQATALEAWIRINDEALAPTYKKLKLATDAALFGGGETTAAGPAGGSAVIRLRVTKATNPDGSAGDIGTLTVTGPGENRAMPVLWEYEDGTTETGIGVAIPDSGKMAVGFGTGVVTVGLYHRRDKEAAGLWVTAKDGEPAKGIAMKQGASASEFEIEGGGKLFFEKGEANTMALKWEFASGSFTGIGVGEGDYLAVISAAPDAAAGVAFFDLSPDGKSATSRWTVIGATGSGTEEMVIEAVAPGAGTAPVMAATAATTGDAESEVRAIAASLREKFANVSQWKPGLEVVAAITANAEAAEKLDAYVETIYAGIPADGSAAKAGQTEILVTGPALADLPGGYSKAAANFKAGVQIYGFKYVAPGETLGMSYDGVFSVDGKWYMIPKAWRAFAP